MLVLGYLEYRLGASSLQEFLKCISTHGIIISFQSFTDGSLFNPKALFKKRKCTILHMNEESKNQQDNLINNIGNVQEALAKILPQDTYYYVDAKKNESLSESYGSELYSYADTEISKLPLHHVTTTYLQSEGNCLTYSKSSSSSDSKLESVGVDCESKLMPLCFRDIGASDLSFINDQCGDCDDFSETPSCNKWSTLEECYEPGDPFKVVSDVKICTDMCGPLVREEQEYCSVSLSLQVPFQYFYLKFYFPGCWRIPIQL